MITRSTTDRTVREGKEADGEGIGEFTAEDRNIDFRFRIGLILIAINYLLWAPTLLFLYLSLTGNPRLWCLLAAVTYGLSWILLIVGGSLVGHRITGMGYQMVIDWFRKTVLPAK